MTKKKLNLIFFRSVSLSHSAHQLSKFFSFKNSNFWFNLLTTQSRYLINQFFNIYTFYNFNYRNSSFLRSDLFQCIATKNNNKLAFSRYYYNGLGYKVFFKNNYLFVWVGLTHYTLIKVPSFIKIFAKKRRFFITGRNRLKFNSFLAQIRRIRKIDLYKGKGLTEIKSYKGFIKMKSGKKKQY